MTTALVTGIGGTRSIAVLQALKMGKEPMRIIGSDANYFNAGSFQCDVAYTVPLANDPTYFKKLRHIIMTEKVSIVFATVEKEVLALSKHKLELESELGVAIIVPEPNILSICFDKYRTQEFLESNNFVSIPSIYCNDQAKLKTFAKHEGLPLIRKPVFGYGSRGLSIINDQAELRGVELDIGYVLQKYIENDDTESFYNTVLNEYTAEVFVNNDYSVAGGIIVKRALHAGETVAGYRVQDPDSLAYLREVAQALKIKGPCNFQYRKHGGKIYIFEINPLFSGTTAVRARLGFNSVYLAVRSFVQNKHHFIAQESLRSDYFIRYLHEDFISPQSMDELRAEQKITNE